MRPVGAGTRLPGRVDIERTDKATYNKMLANVPIDCEESFLGSFFTGTLLAAL